MGGICALVISTQNHLKTVYIHQSEIATFFLQMPGVQVAIKSIIVRKIIVMIIVMIFLTIMTLFHPQGYNNVTFLLHFVASLRFA